MPEKYNPKKIEAKWQQYWEKNKVFAAKDFMKKPKYYCLIEFPYPSAEGLHVGHPRSYTAMDILARKKRMQGFNVLFPIGFDAFGLPAENYAIKKGIHPLITTEKNIINYRRQLKMLGYSFDWDREISTIDPDFYKWTQWIFLQLYKKGLAYKKEMPINWCPSCKIGLANEEVVGGNCERCGTAVTKKTLKQWLLKITKYADRLLKDLDDVDYQEKIKTQQVNWIGKSEGALIKFEIRSTKSTRPSSPQSETNSKFEALNPKYNQILLATNNLSKKKRIEKLLKSIGLKIKLYLPKDLGLKEKDVFENGGLIENAQAKALAYRSQTKLPIMGIDTGFFIKDKEIDPVKVKRNALDGKDEKNFSQQEISELILRYYQRIAEQSGGEVDAYWKDVFVLSLPDGGREKSESVREVVLGSQIKGEVDIYFPIRSLYRNKTTGKYSFEQNKTEELKELRPITEALMQLLVVSLTVNTNIEVFTTRPDTLFGVTYLVLAPEHQLINKLKDNIQNFAEVKKYIKKAQEKSDLERTELVKEKTGVELKGIKAVNPVNNQEIPVWVADYVLTSYGTGAIMAVPAHDQRDFEFANRYSLESKCVIDPISVQNIIPSYLPLENIFTTDDIKNKKSLPPLGKLINQETYNRILRGELPYMGPGELINSGKFDGLAVNEAIKKINNWLAKEKIGEKAINYKLRDWIFSRQHYWGEPIPVVYCEKCAANNKKVLILHGWEDSSKSGFFPALRENLETKGYETFAFDAPNTSTPNFDEWYKFASDRIKKNSLKNFILVGHSMGGLLALKLAEKHRLKKLVLVAPVGSQPSKKYFDQFKDKLTEHELDISKKYQNHGLDIDKIKKNVDEIVFVFGKQDPWITNEIRKFYQENFKDKATVYFLPDQGHMSESEGVKRVEFIEELFDDSASTAGLVPVSEKNLPVRLPEVKKYQPTDTGESPLAAIKDWVNTTCPQCGSKAKRETDTMPNWAGSSWYFLRYCDPKNNQALADQKKLAYWTPVDWYNGGMEHTTLHLLYSRFWHKFLYDLGVVPTKEPYQKRTSQGMILGEDNQKMSKSRGNVVNPDEIVKKYGADTMRMYEMFIGPFSEAAPWSTRGIVGIRRYLERVFEIINKIIEDKKNLAGKNIFSKSIHKTTKEVTDDIDNMRFNTAISQLMIFFNGKDNRPDWRPKLTQGRWEKVSEIGQAVDFEALKIFLKLLSPFAPHLAEELWERLGNNSSIVKESWPEYDKKLITAEEFELVIQINGRVRDKVKVSTNIIKEQAEERAKQSPKIQKYLEDKEVAKVIFVPKRLINFVVK